MHYYQRLLARDEEEAKEVAIEYAKTVGWEKVYDKVFLPALAMARQDRKDAGLEAEDEEFIVNATRAIINSVELIPLKAESGESPPSAAEPEKVVAGSVEAAPLQEPSSPIKRRVLILGCPAHQQTEELTLHMLASLLKPDGCDMEVVSTRSLPTEIETRIEQQAPALVFIAVLPPGGLVQARYLCRRLGRRFRDVPILVGYWGQVSDFDKLLRQVRSAGGNYLATSLLQARSQIIALVHPTNAEEPQPKKVALQEV